MGLFDKLFKKKPEPEPVKKEKVEIAIPSVTKEEKKAVQQTEVAVTIRREYKKVDPIGELSHLEFGKPAGVLGCFLNYEPRMLYEPTERQLSYLKDLGVFVPAGITKEDASCMISRATGEDDLESPGSELVALAVGLGVQFSAFIGSGGLFNSVIYHANDRDRAALFGYAVCKSLQGSRLGNMLEDPAVDLFYSFADQVVEDSVLLRSLNGRKPEDYIHPYKGTAIYKAAVRFLEDKV